MSEENKIGEDEEFTKEGQWKIFDINDQDQKMLLVKQVPVNEAFEFNGLEVTVKSVNIVEFINPVEGIDESATVKYKEGKPLHGIQVYYDAKHLNKKDLDISYPGIAAIKTSAGQEIFIYPADNRNEDLYPEQDTIPGYEYGVNLFAVHPYKNEDDIARCELISILEHGTYDRISWVELDLGGMSTDSGYGGGGNYTSVDALGPVIRVDIKNPGAEIVIDSVNIEEEADNGTAKLYYGQTPWFGDELAAEEQLKYVNKDYGFSLEVPEDWKGSYLVRSVADDEYGNYWPKFPSDIIAFSMVKDGKYIGDCFQIAVLKGITPDDVEAYYAGGPGFQGVAASGNGFVLVYSRPGELPAELYETSNSELANQFSKMVDEDMPKILETVQIIDHPWARQ